jgi:hypothetical protein
MDKPMTLIIEMLRYDPIEGTFKWFIRPSQGTKAGDEAGYVCKIHGYRKIRVKGRDYYANKIAIFLATGVWPSGEVDHINGDKSDDRLCNLRVVTHQQNMWNQKIRADSQTGYKGVSFDKRSGKYRAHIRSNGKRIHLGIFSTAEVAHKAYMVAALVNYGQYARFS